MLIFCHLIIWVRLVTEICGRNLGSDKRGDVLHGRTSPSLRNSNSSNTNYEHEDVTSYLRSHSQDARHIKYNYFFHDTQPARPPGCSPCRKFMPLSSVERVVVPLCCRLNFSRWYSVCNAGPYLINLRNLIMTTWSVCHVGFLNSYRRHQEPT